MDRLTAEAAIKMAGEHGMIEIRDGVFLWTMEEIITDQKTWEDVDDAKNLDFTTSKYWITDDAGMTPLAVTGADDKDLMEFVA